MASILYCNRCGKKFRSEDVHAGYSIHKKITYGSKFDGEDLVLDLCIDCMDNLIMSCEIPPIDLLKGDDEYENEDFVE